MMQDSNSALVLRRIVLALRRARTNPGNHPVAFSPIGWPWRVIRSRRPRALNGICTSLAVTSHDHDSHLAILGP